MKMKNKKKEQTKDKLPPHISRLGSKNIQKLSDLSEKFLIDDDIVTKDEDSFSLFIAENDKELSDTLLKLSKSYKWRLKRKLKMVEQERLDEAQRPEDEFILWESPFGENRDTVFLVGERTFRMNEQVKIEEDDVAAFTPIETTNYFDALKVCARKNRKEVLRANETLNKWRDKNKVLPKSELLEKRVAYYEDVVGLYVTWYEWVKKKIEVVFPLPKLFPDEQTIKT